MSDVRALEERYRQQLLDLQYDHAQTELQLRYQLQDQLRLVRRSETEQRLRLVREYEQQRLQRQYYQRQITAQLTAQYRTQLEAAKAAQSEAAKAAQQRQRWAMAAAVTAGGLVRRGFSGTVESEKFQWELTRLARQLASAVSPLLQLVTKLTGALADWLSLLSGFGQNLLGAGLVGAGLAGLVGLRGGLAAGIAGMALAGPAGAAGLWAGAALLGRMGWLGRTAAGAAGAAAGAAGAAGGIGAAAGAAGAAAATGSTAARLAQGAGKLALKGLKLVPGLGWVLMAGETAYHATTGGVYSEMREKGYSKAWAASSAAFRGLLQTLSFGYSEDWIRGSSASGGGPPADHRTVTIAGGGTQELGAGFESAHEAISRVMAPSEQLLAEIRDLLKSMAQPPVRVRTAAEG